MFGKPWLLIALGVASASSAGVSAQQVGQMNPATTLPSPVSHQDANRARCVAQTSWRSVSTGGAPVRPMPAVLCPYGLDEFIARVTNLSIDKDIVDSVETAEKVFGVPAMTTDQDNPRVSNYRMMLTGKDGWMTTLWVSEGFYPSNTGPARFVPGPHPKRLYDVRDAKLRISLFMGGPTLNHQTCVPVSPLFDALTKAGWTEIPHSGPYSPGDAERHPQFQYGDKTVGVDGARGSCTQDIEIVQNPKKA
jgi:hypothetical protein